LNPSQLFQRRFLLFAVLSVLPGLQGGRSGGRLASFPPVTLWAWERHEDLRALDPRRYAVAYLAETIFIDDTVSTAVRRQPLLVSPEARLIAVVRIEAHAGRARLTDPGLPGMIAGMIAAWARDTRTAAVQVDFDATRSQRPFYGQMLSELRSRLPAQTLLSITALASWCAFDDWIAHLPVDEAVPMFFRMGPNILRPALPAGSTRCASRFAGAWPGSLLMKPGRNCGRERACMSFIRGRGTRSLSPTLSTHSDYD
jgi:hypothetical protein